MNDRGTSSPPSNAAVPLRSTVLSDWQVRTLSALADRLIPPGPDTPGGAAGGAFAYVVRELEIGGNLAAFQAEYRAFLDILLAEGFADLAAAEQDALLTHIEREGDAQARRFFHRVAEHAQEGYYTEPANWPGIGYRVTG